MPGTFEYPGTTPAGHAPPGSGERHRAARRVTSTPTPGGPPHLWALPHSSDHPSGSGPRPIVWAASTSSGMSGAAAAISATGCTVPTSWFALCRQPSAVSGLRAATNWSTSTRPVRSTPTSATSPPAPS